MNCGCGNGAHGGGGGDGEIARMMNCGLWCVRGGFDLVVDGINLVVVVVW